jgi:glycosyltransferase involved in cell wall biosynthesis
MTGRPVILVDCRALGPSGPGRATELLLRGLRELEPPGTWILWGPPEVNDHLWPGARFEHGPHAPRERWGQRDLLRVPPHDLGLYLLQVRPLWPGRSVTLIHDTIQIHYGGTPTSRRLKRAFLRRVGAMSTRVLTVSRFSRGAIQRDLGVPPSKIDIVRYPVDEDMVKRVHELREVLPPRETVLFVGQFAPHKNLDRLIEAFARTRFADDGGELLLVGGVPEEQHRLRMVAGRTGASIHVEGPAPQERIDQLYATCRVLILPSLLEGFGLPALEATACGLPVRVADRGALPELVPDPTLRFDPERVDEIARHIDDAVAQPPDEAAAHALSLADGGSLKSFAASVVEALPIDLAR